MHQSGTDRGQREVERNDSVIEPQHGVAHADLVTMTENASAVDALAVDERDVDASEVAQHHGGALHLEDAVLLADDGIEQLDRAAWVPPDAIVGRQIDALPTLFVLIDETRHTRSRTYRGSPRPGAALTTNRRAFD